VRNDADELLQGQLAGRVNAVEMEAFALIKTAQLYKVKVLAIAKGISDVGNYKSDANTKEVESIPNFATLSVDDRRRAYRGKAARNASKVMIDLIILWAETRAIHNVEISQRYDWTALNT